MKRSVTPMKVKFSGIVIRYSARHGVIHCGECEGPEPETELLA